ncbi:uncharacterized protein (TIGR03085 family) [Brevibacterium sanguinis]|uniref:Uncharacterized protein (TIGR03085 family) n=2 Tax=Brevibacterium TaxID=1696 RepID=A0A366IES5_9MICO|nr:MULTISPECIES: TIGR03085 family metal-binding protein [Brevibacterium]RBP63426.1 uncharacterized protein (TIGR03085 family) [Brevibacterium sanguinis]RBP69893.1 uncharacterized protein (TIGR03085 family) [Brevibacterium celere]
MSSLARTERLRLVSAARRAGEDAPTLCAGWTTRDLATHLVIRERHPVAALGIFSDAFSEKREDQEQAYASMPYSTLLGLVASPPRWNPGAWPGVQKLMNTTEFLVHHEDIRRAEDEWFPRRLSVAENRDVWSQCRLALVPFAAKSPTRIEIVSPGFGTLSAGGGRRGDGRGPAATVVTGEPVEILLYLMGRRSHALVDVRQDG